MVVIAVAPVITLSLASPSPLTVTGTVTPAGPRVTIDLYRVGAHAQRLVASKQRAAAGGSFRARFRPPGPGRYVVIARTAAGTRYAAGASPTLQLTL